MTPSQTQGSDEHQGMNMKFDRIESQIKQALNMNTAQTQALLQEVKDEVAKKHGFKESYNRLYRFRHDNKISYEGMELYINEVAELYHTRLLAEAGKELPSLDKVCEYFESEDYKKLHPFQHPIETAKWMRSEASKVVLRLKEQLKEQKQLWIDENTVSRAFASEIQQLKEELARKTVKKLCDCKLKYRNTAPFICDGNCKY